MKLTKTRVIDALKETRGVIMKAADILGCERQTIYNYRDRYEDVRAAIENTREVETDRAELKLYEAIERGEPWAISLYLKTQGKKRGYFETNHNVNDHRGSVVIDLVSLPGDGDD